MQIIADVCANDSAKTKVEICYMDYGSHMGEYVRHKIQNSGRSISWVAEQLNTSRQNFSVTYLEKTELKREKREKLREVLGQDFFAEFFQKNPELDNMEQAGTGNMDTPTLPKGSGYSISIQIDPDNFNPKNAETLGRHLRKALEDYQNEVGEDNN